MLLSSNILISQKCSQAEVEPFFPGLHRQLGEDKWDEEEQKLKKNVSGENTFSLYGSPYFLLSFILILIFLLYSAQ